MLRDSNAANGLEPVTIKAGCALGPPCSAAILYVERSFHIRENPDWYTLFNAEAAAPTSGVPPCVLTGPLSERARH